MGNISVCPCLGRDQNEKEIQQKENSLMIHKFTAVNIKNAFFQKYQGEIISYANVIKSMQKLTEECAGANTLYDPTQKEKSEALKNFEALLKGVVAGEVSEKIEDCNFKFIPLIIMLILLCKNISKDRIQAILQTEAIEKFNPEQLTITLELIFKTVCDCSLQMIISTLDEDKKKEEISKYQIYEKYIEKAVKESVQTIFKGTTEKTPFELGIMFYQLTPLMSYDAATTEGIRKVLKEFSNEEFQKKQIEQLPKDDNKQTEGKIESKTEGNKIENIEDKSGQEKKDEKEPVQA